MVKEILNDKQKLEGKTLEEHIEENREILERVFRNAVPDIGKLFYEIENLIAQPWDFKTDQDLRDYLILYKLYQLYNVNHTKKKLEENPDVHVAYRLGLKRGQLDVIEEDLQYISHRLDGFSRIASRIAQKKRWPQSKDYDEACEIAENLWSDGDTLNLSQMATYIETELYPDLDTKRLKDRLRPIAKKYNRIAERGRPRKTTK